MAPEQRDRLVREGKRKPIVRPTYESMLNHEKARRGWALRASLSYMSRWRWPWRAATQVEVQCS